MWSALYSHSAVRRIEWTRGGLLSYFCFVRGVDGKKKGGKGREGGGELKENTRPEPRVGNTTHLAAIRRVYPRAPRLTKHAGEHSIYKK